MYHNLLSSVFELFLLFDSKIQRLLFSFVHKCIVVACHIIIITSVDFPRTGLFHMTKLFIRVNFNLVSLCVILRYFKSKTLSFHLTKYFHKSYYIALEILYPVKIVLIYFNGYPKCRSHVNFAW